MMLADEPLLIYEILQMGVGHRKPVSGATQESVRRVFALTGQTGGGGARVERAPCIPAKGPERVIFTFSQPFTVSS